jgi:hypothetical protein
MAWWSNGAGRGALGVAQCPAPLRSRGAAIGIFGWRQIAEGAVRSDFVVIAFPSSQYRLGLRQRGEQRLVEEKGSCILQNLMADLGRGSKLDMVGALRVRATSNVNIVLVDVPGGVPVLPGANNACPVGGVSPSP